METKKMTRKKVFEYLNDTKILCTSTEETVKVQEKLFELGFEWNTVGKIINKEALLLYIDAPNMFYTEMINWWVKNDKKRVDQSEILAIQLKEEKPKFDPSTLQPFDKVLVRNTATDVWCARFFDRCEEHEDGDYGEFGTTCNCFWVMCIPYNEETKHLHNTTEDAPEFYQVWK